MNSLEHNLSWNVTWKMAQMKYNLVAQMKYCIFQKLAQMQYAQITNVRPIVVLKSYYQLIKKYYKCEHSMKFI
jgi:hypothetical protein